MANVSGVHVVTLSSKFDEVEIVSQNGKIIVAVDGDGYIYVTKTKKDGQCKEFNTTVKELLDKASWT